MEKECEFSTRALELHSLYAWDYNWIIECMDFMKDVDMNTLILHRNDFIDLIIYPGRYFGYEEQRGDTIFDVYSHIFRKLYQYTPTRRSSPYQRRAFLKRVLEQAGRRGIAVYIENKELYFPDIILEFYPELVKDGRLCASDPFWMEFTQVKYREFFQEFPEIAGIITAPATGESRLSIKSNRCQCEHCRGMKKEEWFDQLLRAMYQPIHEAGRLLVVRDFVFDPQAHREIAGVMSRLPEDVIISLKNTPHDYYPTFPENPRIGQVGSHRQWIEFDAMGQYFGWGIAMADLTEDYRTRMRHAKEQGADGVILRTDWESLDGHTAFRTPNKINLYAGALLAKGLGKTAEEICGRYLEREGWLEEGIEPKLRRKAVAWYSGLISKTWEITAGMLFTDGCVCTDSSLLPISYEHAFWLSEEKNSIKDWDESKGGALEPVKERLEAALEEKNRAVAGIVKLREEAGRGCAGIQREKLAWFQERFQIHEEYARMCEVVFRALFLTRYMMETGEDRNGSYYEEKRLQWTEVLEELPFLERHLRAVYRGKDYQPHTVYTLLDPDRIRCFYRKLREKEKEIEV